MTNVSPCRGKHSIVLALALGLILPLGARTKISATKKTVSPADSMTYYRSSEVDFLNSSDAYLFYYDVYDLKVPPGFKAYVKVTKEYSNSGALSIKEMNSSCGINVCVDDPNTVTKELYTKPTDESSRVFESTFTSDAAIYLRPFLASRPDFQYTIGVDIIPLIVDVIIPKAYNGSYPYFCLRPKYEIDVVYSTATPVTTLTLDTAATDVPKTAGAGTFKVTANAAWSSKVVSGGSWLSITKGATGSGNGSVSYSYAANKGTASREGKITVTAGTKSVSFTVKQAGSTATAKPNLAFYCPKDAYKSVYLGRQSSGAAVSSTFEYGSPIYLYCAYCNDGGATAPACAVKHQVLDSSGKEVKSSSGTHDPLAKNNYYQWSGAKFGILQGLPVGAYTYVCTLDSDGAVSEKSESDNVAKVSFQVNKTKVSVFFDANGGTCPVSAKEYSAGAKFGTLPKATRADYSFDGWYSARSGGNQVTSSSVASDCTLYAHWTKIERNYTVVFRSSASPENMPPQTCKCDAATRLNANLFTNAGYAFTGWAKEEIGATRIYADGESVKLSSVAGATVVLYAQWEPVVQKVYVSFSAPEAYGGSPADMDYVVGRTYGYLPQVWRSDAVFAGWFVSSSPGARRVTEADAVLLSVTRLYARWAANAYLVRFDPNGGKGSMSDQRFVVGVPQALSKCTFRRSGYYFAGWSRSSVGGDICAPTTGFVFEARQNLWTSDELWKSCASNLVGRVCTNEVDELVVTFGANGTAKSSLKSGKYTFTGSTTLCPSAIGETEAEGVLYFYFAPDKKKKFAGAVKVVDFKEFCPLSPNG